VVDLQSVYLGGVFVRIIWKSLWCARGAAPRARRPAPPAA
jgi:hypothetical protein